ncbi:MAG: hypothetical protein JSV36_09270 [Anaerolineae bacterium]|nr:MAG: hypothetical protein JSV36_09270 [Anaerolineae bacterium]
MPGNLREGSLIAHLFDRRKFAVGLAADNLVNSPERAAQQLVHRAIRTGRTYPGDLFELGQADGINYSAISGVRDQMTGHYSLTVGQITLGVANAVVVVAYFDNAAWINCRVTADQLFHCYDASPPYRQGFPALLTAGETPPDCRACTVVVSEAQRAWLLAQPENVAGPPHVTRLAQWGSHVLMRAEWPANGYAAECLFHGLSPVTLECCQPLSLRGRAAPEAISTQHLGDRFATYGGSP